ncbi:MAG TPA: DUF4831 family protein [Bacteroidales bacterium]|nr:DUF4831 family protein [Bacteroidales bacterium]
MNIKRFFTVAALLLVSVIFNKTAAQVSIVPLSIDHQAHRYEGLYYALPKSKIQVDVWVDKVEVIRGPFAEYAGRLLGLDNVPRVNSESYHLAGISLSTFHEVDPDHYYFVRVPSKGTEGLRFSLSPEGFLQSASLNVPEKSRKTQELTDVSGKLPRTEFVDFTVPNIIERVDTFIRRISIDTTTFEEIFFRKTFIEKTTEQKAREAADFILKLEDHRLSLITGYQEVNYSAEVMQYMNEQLRDLQDEYLALFKGKKVTSTSHYTFTYEPKAGKENEPLTLFRFAANRGIVDKELPLGEQVQISFSAAGQTRKIATHQLLRDAAKPKNTGFYYRIPEKAKINVRMGNEMLAETYFLVNQLGVVSFLPYESVQEIQFHPETGSVKFFRLK